MRNLLLAFGLILIPAVVMAAPSNSNSTCEVSTSTDGSIVAKGCTANERKLIAAAQFKPTTQQVDRGLNRLAGAQYTVINEICKLKGGRHKAARSLVENCYRKSGEGQLLILNNALNHLGDIKACKGMKVLGQQVFCLIDQNNKLLVPLIERTLEARKSYMKAIKFLRSRGCTLRSGKLEC